MIALTDASIPAWGSSSFGVVVTDFREGKICILYEDEYSNETAENMVDLIRELYYKYSRVEKILVDGSQISFIKSLKIALYNELREETEIIIQRYRDNNSDYTLNMKILPVTFTADSSKAMLSHLRSVLVYYDTPKIREITVHYTHASTRRVDETAMSHSDVLIHFAWL